MKSTVKSAVQALPSVRYRLSPGFHLLPVDEQWLLYRPDGRFARVRIRPELSEMLAALLSVDTAFSEIPSISPAVEEEVTELLDRFVAEGVAEVVEQPKTETQVCRRVVIDGEGEVARLLMELLLTAGHEPRILEGGSRTADPESDILVGCAGWLPDTRFRAQDRWCVENGVAWHGFYAEGNRFHIGPFWLPEDPRTVRYEDARARRLAAEIHPDGLEAYWRHIEAGRRVNPPVPPSSAEAALIAGALATDILAWSAGETPPSHGHQLAYDRSTGCWRRHPILPVPRGLMTESMP